MAWSPTKKKPTPTRSRRCGACRRHFEFPKLNKRGVYVIDFIGNGKASRALIRKGKLRYLVRTSVAGQVFTVLDESNEPVPDATLWLAGTLYSADTRTAPSRSRSRISRAASRWCSRRPVFRRWNGSSKRPRTMRSPPAWSSIARS